jgi:hypothetical protein
VDFGALVVVEAAEGAFGLRALDRFLKPWVRGRLDALTSLLEHGDTRRQFATDTRAIAQTVFDYSVLREHLFSDVHHLGPEPPWRVVERGALAIRAQSGVLLRQPTFVLRRLDAGSGVIDAETWDFTVIANPSDGADVGRSFVVMVSAEDRVQVSKELDDERGWYQQVGYGFRALGRSPSMAALYDPDRHG